MKIAVYGSWHLAEVYAVGLCELGHAVNLISDKEVYKNYLDGIPPVFEPGIGEGIKKYRKLNKLFFSDTVQDKRNKSDICFFAQDVSIVASGVDMKDIERHFDKVAKCMLFKLIVVSSQTPIGTMRRWQNRYHNIKIVYFPEFLRFGSALKLFTEPDYIVTGGEKKEAEKVIRLFEKITCPKFGVTFEEAEMSKHAANIFVAMTVSFVSELTKLCQYFDVNFENVGRILRLDKRVGQKAYTLPGLGFAGTVERDFKVLIQLGKKLNIKFPLLKQIIAVNNEHNKFMENELRNRFKILKGKKIGFLGATYKSFTSNMRGSLVAPLMKRLSIEGATPYLYDPYVSVNRYTVNSLAEVFSGADAVVIAVGKQEFKKANYKKLVRMMRGRVIIDAANMFTKVEARKLGADYASIGRGKL